jgi:hypothetical protein
MRNRYIINLFVKKGGDTTRKNFSVELETYNKEALGQIISERLNLNTEKWSIDREEVELVEKERVVFWTTHLKKIEK